MSYALSINALHCNISGCITKQLQDMVIPRCHPGEMTNDIHCHSVKWLCDIWQWDEWNMNSLVPGYLLTDLTILAKACNIPVEAWPIEPSCQSSVFQGTLLSALHGPTVTLLYDTRRVVLADQLNTRGPVLR